MNIIWINREWRKHKWIKKIMNDTQTHVAYPIPLACQSQTVRHQISIPRPLGHNNKKWLT